HLTHSKERTMTRKLKMAPLGVSLILAAAVSSGKLSAPEIQVDPWIPGYQKTSGVSGNLSSVGSDTLANMMTLWAEGFRKQYPNVRIQIEAKGSSQAPPPLIAGPSRPG